MERRGFLKLMVGGVAAAAAVRTFPFRVFSFPKEIQLPTVFGGDPGDLTKTVAPMMRMLTNPGADSWAEAIYMHPFQLDALKEVGYHTRYEIREVEGLSLGYGSSWSFMGIPVRENPHLNPNKPPVFVSKDGHSRRIPLKFSIAHVSDQDTLGTRLLRELLPESSASQRV
jgi:hypothetical protein